MSSSWIIQVGPKSNNKCPYKAHREDRHPEKTVMWRWRQKWDRCMWATKRPRDVWHHQRLGEERKLSPRAPAGVQPQQCSLQTAGLHSCERLNLCCVRPPDLQRPVIAAMDTYQTWARAFEVSNHPASWSFCPNVTLRSTVPSNCDPQSS